MAIAVTTIATLATKALGGTTIAITVPAGGVPAHATIIIGVSTSGALSATSNGVTDTGSNSYQAGSTENINTSGAGVCALRFAFNVAALVSTNTITVTLSDDVL